MSNSKSKSNVISIPAKGSGAPFTRPVDGRARILINVYSEDGSRQQFMLDDELEPHDPDMTQEIYAFIVRNEICASGKVDLANWTLVGEYDANQSGLAASGVKF